VLWIFIVAPDGLFQQCRAVLPVRSPVHPFARAEQELDG
jgi:hypothetical protein